MPTHVEYKFPMTTEEFAVHARREMNAASPFLTLAEIDVPDEEELASKPYSVMGGDLTVDTGVLLNQKHSTTDECFMAHMNMKLKALALFFNKACLTGARLFPKLKQASSSDLHTITIQGNSDGAVNRFMYCPRYDDMGDEILKRGEKRIYALPMPFIVPKFDCKLITPQSSGKPVYGYSIESIIRFRK